MPKLAEMLSEHALGFAGQLSNEELAAWLDVRCGKLTASCMSKVVAVSKTDGKPLKSRADLIRSLLAERITGLNMRNFVSDAMRWGLEQEPHAKAAYMQQTGKRVRPSMFYEHPTIENFGATPDGELDADTFFEFKCPTTSTFIEWTLAGVVPPEYKPQMLSQIACGRRGRVIFVAYDPRITDQSKQLFIRDFVPKIEEVERIEAEAVKFLDELDQAWEAFVTA